MPVKLLDCFRKQIKADFIRVILGGLQEEAYDQTIGKPQEEDVDKALKEHTTKSTTTSITTTYSYNYCYPLFVVLNLYRIDEGDSTGSIPIGKIIIWKKGKAKQNQNQNQTEEEEESEKEIYNNLMNLRSSQHSASLEIFEHSLRLLQNFNDNLSTLAHEIRTPIAEVTMLIRDSLENPELQESNLNTALEACAHTTGLIQDLTDVCRATRGTIELELSEAVICTELEHVFKLFKVKCEEKKINLLYDCCLAPDLKVITDAPRFRRIFTNLIGNAIKFVPNNGEGTIIVHSNATPCSYEDILNNKSQSSSSGLSSQIQADPSKDYVKLEFSIRDNGKGIKKELQHLVFKQFFQGDPSVKGEGIGLHMVKNIIKAMGGEIWIESKEGEGTCVFFNIIVESKKLIFPDSAIEIFAKLKKLSVGIIDPHPLLSSALYTAFTKNEIFQQVTIIDPNDLKLIENLNKDVLFIDSNAFESLNSEKITFKVKKIVLTTPVYGLKPSHPLVIQHPMKRSEVFPTLLQLGANDDIVLPKNNTILSRRVSIKSDSIISPPPSPPTAPKYVKKVLLIDDNIVISQLLSRKLSLSGYSVFSCKSASDVESALKDFDYHFVLMDVNLWDNMDGFELSRKIRQLESFKKLTCSKIICISEINQNEFISKNWDSVMNVKIDSSQLLKNPSLVEA